MTASLNLFIIVSEYDGFESNGGYFTLPTNSVLKSTVD